MLASEGTAVKNIDQPAKGSLLIFELRMQPAMGGLRPGIGANGSSLVTFAIQDSIELQPRQTGGMAANVA